MGGRMDLYLFKSTSSPNLRALTKDPCGAILPSSLGPWTPYGEPGVPMEHVSAVSDEIQEGLDFLGYFVTDLGRTVSQGTPPV